MSPLAATVVRQGASLGEEIGVEVITSTCDPPAAVVASGTAVGPLRLISAFPPRLHPVNRIARSTISMTVAPLRPARRTAIPPIVPSFHHGLHRQIRPATPSA